MERLTERSSGALPILVRKRAFGPAYFSSQRDYQDYRDAIDRLAAYEDTGLEPKEIQEAVDLFGGHTDGMPQKVKKWAERAAWHVRKSDELQEKLWFYEQAEDEGRMMVIPRGEVGMIPKLLSLGAPVWFLFHDNDTEQWEIEQERITGVGIEGFWCSGLTDQPDAATYMTKWDEVGERAFFSERDAEKARKEANGQ